MKQVTLNDLAKYTGVSKSTISRVYNNPEKVKDSTLKQVHKAASELGYYPNRVARRLQAGRGNAKVIGLIVPDIKNPFFADITRGIENVCRDEGYTLILTNSEESVEWQNICLEALRMEGVDGIILPPVHNSDRHVNRMIEDGYNIVCVDRHIRNSKCDKVLSDNRKGGYMATSHLIGLGHQRIAFIGGIEGISTTVERRDGYIEALTENGIKVDEELILDSDSRQYSGEELAKYLLSLSNPPTALFTGNNLITLGTLVICNRLGIKIPDDIALVGYDDVSWSNALNPPPTVISQPAFEIGQRAAEVLLSRIRNPKSSPVTVMLEPKMIVRYSCGKKSFKSKKVNGNRKR